MKLKFESLDTVLSREEAKMVKGGDGLIGSIGGEGLSCDGPHGQRFCRSNSFCLDCINDGFGLASCQRNSNCRDI